MVTLKNYLFGKVLKVSLILFCLCQQPVRMRFVFISSRLFVGQGFTLVLPQKAIWVSSTKNLPPSTDPLANLFTLSKGPWQAIQATQARKKIYTTHIKDKDKDKYNIDSTTLDPPYCQPLYTTAINSGRVCKKKCIHNTQTNKVVKVHHMDCIQYV